MRFYKMNNIVFLFFFICFAFLHSSNGSILRQYDLSDHPFSNLPAFSSFSSSSEIVKRFHRLHIDSNRVDARHIGFEPRSATFYHFGTTDAFCTNLDALAGPTVNEGFPAGKTFMEVELHRKARVFVILSGGDAKRDLMKELKANPESATFTGLPAGWHTAPIPLAIPDRENRDVLKPHVSGMSYPPRKFFPKFPTVGVAFEIDLPSDLTLRLQNPNSITVNGRKMAKITLLFAKPDTSAITAFPPPAVPPPFQSHITSGGTVNPAAKVPVPNAYCPDWVHDIYVTRNRAGEESAEPDYWRTWHPQIDPVYYCYFDHEHGSFPGAGYSPMYTAWKNNRQDESHKGFKVLSFPVPNDGRVVTLTLHMHVSKSRRFSARHHTLIFAVLDPNTPGAIQAEIHLKLDFGALLATLSAGKTVPIDATQEVINTALRKLRVRAGRRVNVVNIDGSYPDSVDKTYKVRITGDPKRLVGIYEQWRAIFPTCVDTNNDRNAGFRFDVRDPSTSMRYPTDYESMSELNGKNMKRVLSIRAFKFDKNYCTFKPSTELFFTNPYFTALETGPGASSVRQYIKNGFQPLSLPTGQINLLYFWSGPFAYGSEKMRPVNMANAVNKKKTK